MLRYYITFYLQNKKKLRQTQGDFNIKIPITRTCYMSIAKPEFGTLQKFCLFSVP